MRTREILFIGVFLIAVCLISLIPFSNFSENFQEGASSYPTTKPVSSSSPGSSITLANTHIEPLSGEYDDDEDNFEPIQDVPTTVNYGPFRDSGVIDKFSQVTSNGMDGVNGCVSSGLSNARGQICLTPELIDLLKTRGGNASGKCN